MKAILLAGGKGTRLRPLTLHTPKPIVPIFDRPFLRYQIDLLRQVPEIDEVVLSLNYQPRRIEEVFGDGSDLGIHLRYVVEPTPLGTGGAIRFAAGDRLGEPIVVFNGDVLTAVDLPAVIRLHRERQAKATIVLTPVENPSAYGLVETDAHGNILAFLEKPSADQIRCDTINAGIYVLEPDTLERVPRDTAYSIERSYFPSLIHDRATFVAHIDRGYWIDIGTPEKYRQAHRDIMDGRLTAPPFASTPGAAIVSPEARIEEGATITGPCFIDAAATIKRGARIGPYSVIGRHSTIAEEAAVDGCILWPNTWVESEARLVDTLAGRNCHFGRNVDITGGLFGDKSVVTDYSQT
ncbi:MAG TPA: NDP-sugar synthase [Vicinamibacterales bacterium]|nr:NDP-sugar synthase [Vicinamibacterales bacterium]